MTGGAAYWGPNMLEDYYGLAALTATLIMGAITVISGTVAVMIGSSIVDKRVRKYRTDNPQLPSKQIDLFKIEYACKILFIVTLIGFFFALTAAITGFLYTFLAFFAIGEFLIFLGIGPCNISLMTTLPLDLRDLGNGYNIFFLHFLGDFLSPFFIGLISDQQGMYVAMIILMGWLIFAVIFWGVSWRISIFHEAPWSYIKSHFFSRKIDHFEGDKKLNSDDFGSTKS